MALGSYNIARFNIGDIPPNSYTESYSMYVTMTAGFDAGSLITPVYWCNQDLRADLRLGWGYDVAFSFAAELAGIFDGDVFFAPIYVLTQALTARTNCSPAYHAGYNCVAGMSAVMTGNYAVYPLMDLAQPLAAMANGKIGIYPLWGVLVQNLGGHFSSVPITTTEMAFDLVIPAGGKLVIDSDNFTAYINDEDAMYAYSGDWIRFARALQGVDISSGTSGDIDVKVLYREQYL